MITLPDAVVLDVQDFLDACEGEIGNGVRAYCQRRQSLACTLTCMAGSPSFLLATEHGKKIPTIEHPPLFLDAPFDLGKHTIGYEARYLKALFNKVA